MACLIAQTVAARVAQLVELTADANMPEPKMEKRVPG